MSSDEKTDLRDEDESVEGHKYVTEDRGDDDLGKTKTRAEDADDDDFHKTKT